MDLKQLEAFVYVIKLRSFSKTAEKLYLTQPTISAHIASLERELGVKLIVRTTKEVYPSGAGQVLFQYAQDMLNLRESAMSAIRDFEKEISGSIAIAVSTVPGQCVLPEIMSEFRKIHPDISFKIQKCDSADAIKKLISREVEIGMTGTVIDTNKCVFRHFVDDEIVVVTPNEQRFKGIKKISVEMLEKEPMIVREEGSGTRREAEKTLRENGVDTKKFNIVAVMEDQDSIIKSVGQGLGISMLSKKSIEDYEEFGRVLAFRIDGIKLQRKLYIARNKLCPLSPSAKAFYDFACKYYGGGGSTAEAEC